MSRNPFHIGRRNAVRLTIALALSAAGCAKKEEATPTAQTPPPEATSPAPAAMTDANIAAIVVAANTIDVENGELAKTKTKNAGVKAFAEQMITDHKSVNKQAT